MACLCLEFNIVVSTHRLGAVSHSLPCKQIRRYGFSVFCPSLKPYTFEVVLMSSPIPRDGAGSDEDEKLLEHHSPVLT